MSIEEEAKAQATVENKENEVENKANEVENKVNEVENKVNEVENAKINENTKEVETK